MATRRAPMSEINVVPYIDVMLVLLVIFMVTAPLMTQGVEVDLPNTDSKPLDDSEDDPLVVSLDAEGRLFVNTGLANDSDAFGTRVTIFSLADQARKIVAARPDIPVYVRADESIVYGKVIEVMTVLQHAGAQSVGLITDPVDNIDAPRPGTAVPDDE